VAVTASLVIPLPRKPTFRCILIVFGSLAQDIILLVLGCHLGISASARQFVDVRVYSSRGGNTGSSPAESASKISRLRYGSLTRSMGVRQK
jgi:hypothetical protein